MMRYTTKLPRQTLPGYLVGLDIGGTKTAVAVADTRLAAVSQIVVPTHVEREDKFLDSVVSGINLALKRGGVAATDVAGFGVGIPGRVDSVHGTVQYAANLNLDNYPLGARLHERYQKAVALENDVRLATVGVYDTLRHREALQSLAYLSIGTGIAAGLVLDGRLYRGANGMAGEVGHIIVQPDGELCGCGARGCLETIASGPAIARQAAPALEAAGYAPPFTAEQAFEAAKGGNTAVQNVIQRAGHYLSRAIQWLIMTYDVEKVVLGGGVTSAGAAIMEPILSELSQLRSASPLAHAMLPPEKVLLWPSATNAGTWGAILLAQDALAE